MANMNVPCPTDASIILTYRCPMRCVMFARSPRPGIANACADALSRLWGPDPKPFPHELGGGGFAHASACTRRACLLRSAAQPRSR